MVDTPSSGKRDFNYTHVVGLIQFILIQFIFLLSLWCSSNVHVLVGFLSHECWLLSSFSYCGFSQIQVVVHPVFSRYVCVLFGLPWMTMVQIDHPVVVHTEKNS